ncbi:uncharacterized protein MEPE_02800 [Melanopsichium pennsylvanicum]|uniref:Yeast cell wall synthesis Kre9/Knh1-like N-terminal domain-containing protein n=2 Tax=Melanopsichium pennsylvanicum TaxID=63383 RepID=A0AAJ5C4W0_9BASI|nr:uncharacterized protein MEPE_02800 [Melanopsichium pennsylvanicum]
MKFVVAALAPLALLFSPVVAQSSSASSASGVSPLTPSTTDEGSPLLIEWDTTTNQSWASMEIKFMTGSNQNMTELYTVATGVDGTSAGQGKLNWTAPNVDPNSAIYFFQFTHGGEDPTWTTRFAIADASGATTSPPHSTQPEGAAIPWGTGRIVGASVSASSGSSSASASASGASASVSASVSASASDSSTSASMTTSTSQSSTSMSSSSSSSSGSSQTSGSSSSSSNRSTSGASPVRFGPAGVVGCVVAALASTMLF